MGAEVFCPYVYGLVSGCGDETERADAERSDLGGEGWGNEREEGELDGGWIYDEYGSGMLGRTSSSCLISSALRV